MILGLFQPTQGELLLDGIEVNYEINRTNGCGIDDWERVFAGLVPPPAT